ncbi:MAG TPA: ABC transporter ATP-binding protein [Roseiflexaceae bacterium]|jgi:ABC-type multidrug transport system fused ATPase/permease subunit|nr:ABC transporter ATP-binding protein [Roseiflexaceae bacterium]
MFASLTHGRALLGAYLRPQRGRVFMLAALLLSGIALQLLNPQVIRYFIDTTQQGGPQSSLTAAAVAFLVVALLQRAVELGAVYVGANIGWAATNALRADLARHLLRLDMSFHKQRTPGELIERVDGDVTALANFFSQFAIQLLGNGLLIVAVLALLFREDWRIGAGMTLYALLTLFVLGILQQRAVQRWAAERESSADLYGFLEERMNGTEDIRASGAEAHVLWRLYAIMDDLLRKTRLAQLITNISTASTSSLYAVSYALGLAAAAYLYTTGAATIGTAYVIVFYIGMLAAPLDNVLSQFEDLQRSTASVERVQELFGLRTRVEERAGAKLLDGPLSVIFENVTFRYNDEGRTTDDERRTQNAELKTQNPTLQDISFTLQPGHVLGLLGRTGSGKTTLTRLLFRLYDPACGAIRLGGHDLRDLALHDLRAHVGVVTQDVQIFGASVRDNLTFFNSRISDEQIYAALDQLGLREWVAGLPHGLDTVLAGGGQSLSAGEAQLLAFTRVFLKNPGLVILDEASSRLDPATEHLLEQAIGKLLNGRTGIIIAHRLRTVQRADSILVLENGEIIEHGPREQLARDEGSRFYHLLQTGMEEVLA